MKFLIILFSCLLFITCTKQTISPLFEVGDCITIGEGFGTRQILSVESTYYKTCFFEDGCKHYLEDSDSSFVASLNFTYETHYRRTSCNKMKLKGLGF